MSVSAKQDEIVKSFSSLSCWEGKYKKIIEIGKSASNLDEKLKTKDYLVPGCQSELWLVSEFKDGKLIFKGDSEALITKGLLTLVLSVYSNQSPKEILESKEEFIKTIGLSTHLSPSRTNGVYSLIKKIKYYALAYSLK